MDQMPRAGGRSATLLPPEPRFAVAALLLLCSTMASAAVIGQPESVGPDNRKSSHGDLLPDDKGRGAKGQDKAVDLLIDLQSKRPGVDFNERSLEGSSASPTRRPGSSGAPGWNGLPTGADTRMAAPGADGAGGPGGLGANAATPMPPATAGGLFGTTAAPVVQREVNLSGPSAGGQQAHLGRPVNDSSTGGAGLRWLLPTEWLRFLRDNRDWIAGGAIGAVVLWIIASIGSRRWR